MQRTLAPVVLAILLAGLTDSAVAQVYVRGHNNSNGTYVNSYYRTYPDSNRQNNWSTSPNVNPYTGERGRRSPWGAVGGAGALGGAVYALRRRFFRF